MTDATLPVIAEILDFWFAPGMDQRWFKKDPDFDREVRARWLVHYERAAAGDYDGWSATPEGCLALCLLLDQVPRNLFRDDPRAFATDGAALAVTKAALEQGFDRCLSQVQRLFLYMPLEHSEALDEQEACVRLMAELDENPKWHDYAIEHRDIIARFGRFPRRNAALGRETTDEETAFLKEEGSSF